MNSLWVKYEMDIITVQYEEDENKAAIRSLANQSAKHHGTNSRKYQNVSSPS